MRWILRVPVVWVCLLFSEQNGAAANGGISLGQTRVIFSAADKAQTVKVKNTDGQTYLIQSKVLPASGKSGGTPFIVIPPLFALHAESQQLLRIVSQGGEFPSDRESLFYLEVLAIPTLAGKEKAAVQVSMGLRFVLKMFYRPAGLNVAPAACRLQMLAHPDGVRIKNPTPYYQTLGRLVVNNTSVNLHISPSMLAPLSEQIYSLGGRATRAEWQTLTDYGDLSALCQQIVSPIQEKP
ncbi:hypothetical protein Z042_00965 [Chania multitudinisentens RB-25]|uniref:Pilus assembly protein PapD n=1 Tax=Chania multitudinisentens RB-25 TaxID=1441930 RepID=W0L8T6_9GAMM|nr:molecular chaperone [Chania multitudinisentens]AHG18375.2 hypothetical protein Z042_00965 [Chania multitudinisentens RB-25]